MDAIEAITAEVGGLLMEITDEGRAPPELTDAITSAGERLAAEVVAASLRAAGLPSFALDTRPLILTDDHFGGAHVHLDATYAHIREWRASLVSDHPRGAPLAVATGFIGATADAQTTTLGRGGSDYSAAIFGAALAADEIEIWTDVDGVMSADPRAVPEAFTLPALTYAEAMELAHFGAKVIFPPTMRPAMASDIPLSVRNTFHPNGPTTRIAATHPPFDRPITGLTSISAIALLRLEGSGMIGVPGVAQRLFGALARQRISVILVTQGSSEHSICLALDPPATFAAIAAIETEFAGDIAAGVVDPVIVQPDCAIIAVVGEAMRQRPGIAGELFSALGQRGVNVIAIAQGSSELNISLVVASDDEARALNAIHDAFFTTHRPEVNIYLAGAGVVGYTISDVETLDAMRALDQRFGYTADPHTAVGYAALLRDRAAHPDARQTAVILATAHPAKFPDTGERAIGRPIPLPERLRAALDHPSHVTPLANDYAALRGVLLR